MQNRRRNPDRLLIDARTMYKWKKKNGFIDKFLRFVAMTVIIAFVAFLLLGGLSR